MAAEVVRIVQQHSVCHLIVNDHQLCWSFWRRAAHDVELGAGPICKTCLRNLPREWATAKAAGAPEATLAAMDYIFEVATLAQKIAA